LEIFFVSENDDSSDSEIVFESEGSEHSGSRKTKKSLDKNKDDDDSGGIVFAEKSFAASSDEKVVPTILK
jgi:hypothetical protein